MPPKGGEPGKRHLEIVRGDDTYRFRADGTVELTRARVGAGVQGTSIQDENIISRTSLNRPISDTAGSALKLGRTDMAEYDADLKLRGFRTTAAPGALFDRDGGVVSGGTAEVRGSRRRWQEIARELRVLEQFISEDLRNDPEVVAFYDSVADGR